MGYLRTGQEKRQKKQTPNNAYLRLDFFHLSRYSKTPLYNAKQDESKIVFYNNIMTAPANPVTKMYAPSCNKAMSSRGITTEPASLFLLEDDKLLLEELLEDTAAAPVGKLVTVPVPAEPAALTMLLQSEFWLPDWILAFPLKSQAVEAWFWLE